MWRQTATDDYDDDDDDDDDTGTDDECIAVLPIPNSPAPGLCDMNVMWVDGCACVCVC